MKNQLSLFVATLATLFSFLAVSAQGEWKWANYWSGTGGEPGFLYNYVSKTAFDEDGNVYIWGVMGGQPTFNGSTFLFINNPQVYGPAKRTSLLTKFDSLGNLLWYKVVKSSFTECFSHWLEVKDNKVYISGNLSLGDVDHDVSTWLYYFDTLITASQAHAIPDDQRLPPYKPGFYTYFATFDLDGNLLDNHFVNALTREYVGGDIRGEEPLCLPNLGCIPVHVDNEGNTYVFTRLGYNGGESDPYTIQIDGDTNRKYDIYLPGNVNLTQGCLYTGMMYKFSPSWELLFAKQLIDHSDGIGLSIGDSINPYTPSLSGFSVDEEGNFYLSGHFVIPSEDIYFNVPPQFPVHIYWDSIHYVTIQDYSSDITPFIIKYNADGELLWCNQIYTLGSHDPNLPDHANSNVSGCYYNNGHVYMIGVGAYGPQGSVYFDDPSHPLSQMVENQLNIGFFVGYDAMTGHYVSHGIVPANNSGTGFRLAALHNRVFAYAIANLINQAFYQWREDGLFIHADTIYSSSSFGYGNTYVNNQGYMAISGECQSSVTFSDNVSVCSSPTVCKSAVIALYHNPEFTTPYVGIPAYDRLKPGVRLWPNPATERITIESEEEFLIISVSVANMQGTILTLLPVNDVRCTLNVHNLAPGTYIAHVETKAGINDVKFVVGRN